MISTRGGRTGCVLAGLLLAGCSDKSSGGASTATSTSPAASNAATVAATATASAVVSASAPAVSAASAAVPSSPAAPASASWPAADAPAPSEADWTGAEAFNQADPKDQLSTCHLARIREWFRATCKKTSTFTADTDLGKQGTDYFTTTSSEEQTVTVRSRPGRVMSGTFGSAPLSTHLRIAWPTDEPRASYATLDTRQSLSLWDIDVHEPTDIPDVPVETSAPPADADWLKGVDVNTGDKPLRYPGCSIRVLRDWFRVRCGQGSGSPMFNNLVNGGELNKDVFTKANYNDVQVIAHMKKGVEMTMMVMGKPNAFFKFTWAAGSAKPSVISLERTENSSRG